MKNFFRAFLFSFILGFSHAYALDIEGADAGLAKGVLAPNMDSNLWVPVGRNGIDLEETVGEEMYWLRAKDPQNKWVIYGPLHYGDIISFTDIGSTDIQFFTLYTNAAPTLSDAIGKESGLSLSRVGKPLGRFGPINQDIPKIPVAKFEHKTWVGLNRSDVEANTSRVRAGIESDPESYPDDTQEVFCQSPMRAFNRENYPVTIYWNETYQGNGSLGCTGRGESTNHIDLSGQTSKRIFCSIRTSPTSNCSISRSASQIRVILR